MRRVPEVLDCWFESGSMPFAQVHYPFENAEWFEHHFPADFIVEYIGQTRGWFYTLHVLATALFDRPAFATCIAHGVVLGDDGQKLSKRLRNYPDPDEVFETHGSDAMRWFLMSSPVLRGGDLHRRPSTGIRGRGAPGRCCRSGTPGTSSRSTPTPTGVRGPVRTDADRHVLDRYVLAKTRHAGRREVTAAMDAYDLSGACAPASAFLDALNNWYIRRSRDRFWARATRATPVDTLLHGARRAHPGGRAAAAAGRPRRSTTASPASAASTSPTGPTPDELPADAATGRGHGPGARGVLGGPRRVRKANGLRARLPLASLTVAAPERRPARAVRRPHRRRGQRKGSSSPTTSAAPAVRGRPVGARGARAPARRRHPEGDPRRQGRRLDRRDGDTVVAGRHRAARRRVHRCGSCPAGRRARRPRCPATAGVVVLDTEVTPELNAEGMARDLVRVVQQARRDAGLHVSDRIRLVVDAAPGSDGVLDAVLGEHRGDGPDRDARGRPAGGQPVTPVRGAVGETLAVGSATAPSRPTIRPQAWRASPARR